MKAADRVTIPSLIACRRCGRTPELEFKNYGRGWGKVDRLNVRILHFCDGVTIDLSHSANSNDHEKFMEPLIDSWQWMNGTNEPKRLTP